MYYDYYGIRSVLEFILLLGGTLVVIFSQIKIKSAYSKYKKVKCQNKLSGFEVARKILDNAGLENVHIVEVAGELSDHYDPSQKVVRLSKDVFHGQTIASTAIAAHECGHAMQDKEQYNFMIIRSKLVPVVNFATKFGYFATIIGVLFGILDFAVCGVVILLFTLAFQLVTLPVEFNASARAKKIIYELDLATSKEQDGIQKVLSAAAFTYVAGVLNTLLQMLRLLIRINNNRK